MILSLSSYRCISENWTVYLDLTCRIHLTDSDTPFCPEFQRKQVGQLRHWKDNTTFHVYVELGQILTEGGKNTLAEFKLGSRQAAASSGRVLRCVDGALCPAGAPVGSPADRPDSRRTAAQQNLDRTRTEQHVSSVPGIRCPVRPGLDHV